MAIQTRMKVRRTGTKAEVLVLVNHPMESGHRIDEQTNKPIPAHYIESMQFTLNSDIVAELGLGPRVATNPMTGILLDNLSPGDLISVSWTDNQGQNGGAEQVVT